MIHEGVEEFLQDILLDMSDKSSVKLRSIIESHDFIDNKHEFRWFRYACSSCKYNLEDICWVNNKIWEPITCDEAKIKRALE